MDKWLVLRGVLVLLLLGTLLIGGSYHAWTSNGTNEVYTVKTQQVQDTSTVNDSAVVALDDLRENNQKALHRAFKESDHFWGDAEVSVRFDHEIEGISGWKLVSIDGAYMLVSIQHERTDPQTQAAMWDWVVGMTVMVGWIPGLYGLAALGAGLQGGREARRFRKGY